MAKLVAGDEGAPFAPQSSAGAAMMKLPKMQNPIRYNEALRALNAVYGALHREISAQ